ncbi:achaete-scute homolog 5 [Austrofundulus limnaeus]|uniref:Achaete-scute homolog 5 n=1 Tax=Austrofundulus limnaeus TaxID=52670 RepID=A0A2I4C6A5_AUSLI|nr:PREDICTED: achaete-scute homolog 5-like [Austrofundulus limnaeus]
MMSFSQSLFDRFGVSPSAGLEDNGVPPHLDSLSSSVPFLFYPSTVDPAAFGLYKTPLRGPGPSGILPYLPFHHGHFGVYECPFEPAFIQKRNERERQRVKCVNQGYAKLRDHLPGRSADKRLSKVETLRAAIRYIKYLQGLVEDGHRGEESSEDTPPDPQNGGETQAFMC